ncbi:MAG: UDP-N-acetylmuramoyl-L-alanine--D-glutamate ligase [Acidobacteriota bacterium]
MHRWRSALVYGLGLSGLAAARLLRRRGVEVAAIDRRSSDEIELGDLAADPGFRVLDGGELEALPASPAVDAIVVSPGIDPQKPLLQEARDRGLPVLGELELAFRSAGGRVVAITGSNGKSTTTSLAGVMLRHAGFDARVCGNIGQPFSAVVPDPEDPPGAPVYVVEASSFQLESIQAFHPEAAALLNLAPDHLDRHADFDAYRTAKAQIFAHHTDDDVAVLNADDPALEAVAPGAGRRRYFSRRRPVEDGCFLDGDQVVEAIPGDAPRALFTVSDVPLPGPHNLENAMAAALLALAAGATPADVRRGLHGFTGLPHRLQKVAELDGVEYFDDSKGTNLAATLGSLSGFEDGRVLIVLGGIFKGGELDELARLVARKARHAYLIGESADRFDRALRAFPGMTADVEISGTLERAVEQASTDARPGDVVLLSPACSSFDQFSDYAERGRVFQRLVHSLEGVARGA